MKRKTKYLINIILLSLVDIIIPIPILGIILIYVILQRPFWFMDGVRNIYEER